MTRFCFARGVAAIGLLAAVNAFAQQYPLVAEGTPSAKIQMNPRPSAPEFRAAVELQDYIKKISRATVPRSTYPAVYYRTVDSAEFTEILPVTLEYGQPLMPKAMREKLSAAESDEAFYIKTAGQRIFIVGKEPIGVLYGVYTFLEKYLGVRWFHPGADGEYCPTSKNISLAEIDDFQEPSIPGRHINCWVKSVEPWTMEEVRVWQARNKLQFGSFYQYNDRSRDELDFYNCGNRLLGGGGHSTFESAVPKKLFESHPEYFPLKGGKRVCEERSQRCLANPDVQQRVVEYALEMAAYGATFSISFHDSTFECWCQCPECLRMGTYKGKFTVSNLAHRFTSEVADHVLKRNPQARLNVNCYSVFRDLPTDPRIRYDERVNATYCPHQRCYVHGLDDPKKECNVKFFKELVDWQRKIPKIGIFDYYAYAQSPYAPMEYTLAKDIKLYRKMKLDHWIDDCTNKEYPAMHANWQFHYVAAKMLWDASLDVDQLLLAAHDQYYGAAADPMKKYQALRRELWESATGHAAYGGPKRIAYCLADPGAEKRMTGYLGEAVELAGNDAVLKRRIAADQAYLSQFWVKEAEEIRKRRAGQNDIPVREREGKITVDGVLDEEAWRKAPLVTGFLTANHDAPIEETRVKVLYDQANWYIGVEALTEHAWSALQAQMKERDSEIWKDDSLEIFIMPPDADYYHWVINSIGTFYDAKVRTVAFDSKAEIKTSVLKDRYLIEARIPTEPMGARITDGQTWRMHVYRACGNLQPPKTNEGSSLDGTAPHEQTLFRRAVIGQSVINNGQFAELVATPEESKGITSDKFPACWGGNQAKLIPSKTNRNRIELTDCLYTGMNIPLSEKGQAITGEITLSGKGNLTVWASTCIRKPDDKRAFGHEIKHETSPYELTEKPASHRFKVDLEPYETGYLYFRVSGKALIDCISATRTEL